jgi:hypothetical protein
MQNKISITIDAATEKAILDKIAELVALLPGGLITLTDEDRKGIALMGDKSIPFVDKALDIAAQNPMLCPPYVNLEEARRDFTAFRSLSSILRAIAPVVGRVKDSAQLCGSEAYTSGLSIYNSARDGEHRGVPGAKEAVHELSPRFPGRGAAKPKLAEQ